MQNSNITPHTLLCKQSVDALFNAVEPKELVKVLQEALLGYLYKQDEEPTTDCLEIGFSIALLQSFILTVDPATAENLLDTSDVFVQPLEIYHAQLSVAQGKEGHNGK